MMPPSLAHRPPSPNPQPAKRHRPSSEDDPPTVSSANDLSPTSELQTDATSLSGSLASRSMAGTAQISGFRNVSACYRCRLRKNRCDQKLPSCASCAKAGVACVGYDPITKKEIPRSYVFYLETRVEQLEAILRENNVDFPAANDLESCSRPGLAVLRSGIDLDQNETAEDTRPITVGNSVEPRANREPTGMANIASQTKPRSLASTSGVSFARVVFAAVQHSVSDPSAGQEKQTPAPRPLTSTGNSASMRDCFFGLHTKPTIHPVAFPSREVGARLVRLYFEHANPQIPILHRDAFMEIFEQVYSDEENSRTPRNLYLLNMVFAIGSGVIVGEPIKSENKDDEKMKTATTGGPQPDQPEEYHASAIVHLEACLSNSTGGLDVLQAVLLLANFALLRPVPPGLWYIVGVAVRLAVDLGLHQEDGGDAGTSDDMRMDDSLDADEGADDQGGSLPQGRGRKLYMRDMRRRLWWCTYALDRLVCTCVGRPFGISDHVITTEFPSLLDDRHITPDGMYTPLDTAEPSYKHVAQHYLRLRLLQSEILQVLQYNQAQIARAKGLMADNPYLHVRLPSPYLVGFDSFRSWRIDIDRRLYEWKTEAPTRNETGVLFSTEFLELNYWQAIILLYRQSLSVPPMFEGEYNTSREVDSPSAYRAELAEDEDRIYLKVAEAGQRILRIYRQLHLSGLVSYTYLSTHHLFMAGILYLYAIWHSPIVRSRLTMEEVDFTILAAKSVFTDLIEKCPPAETCRDAFDRTAKATVKMVNSAGGFNASRSRRHRKRQSGREPQADWGSVGDNSSSASLSTSTGHSGTAVPPSGLKFERSGVRNDNLSSPALSVSSEFAKSPGIPRPYDDGFGLIQAQPVSGSPSTSSRTGPESVVMGTPPMRHAMTTPQGNLAYSSAYDDDAQTLDFLQTLRRNPNSSIHNNTHPNNTGMGGANGTANGTTEDAAQLDIGFGINWDGIGEDFSGETPQVNLFDGFYFSGQPGGVNGL